MAILVEPTQSGRREDLLDLLSIVDAKATPVFSMAKKEKGVLNNMLFQWQADAYPVSQAVGWADGKDVVAADYENPGASRAKLSNYAQVVQRQYSVGFLAQGVSDVAGIADEMANGRLRAAKMVARDTEVALCSTNQLPQADAGDSVTPYLMKNLYQWVNTGAGSGATQTPAGFLTPTGSICTVTTPSIVESDIRAVLSSIYSVRGLERDYDLVCGTTLKLAFTALTAPTTVSVVSTATGVAATRIQTFNRELTSNEVGARIDIYVGDFGRFLLHPSTQIGTTGAAGGTLSVQPYRGYVLAMDEIRLRFANLPEILPLPNAGGGPKELMRQVVGLVVGNPLGQGKFAATS